jgi:hypothetical protein
LIDLVIVQQRKASVVLVAGLLLGGCGAPQLARPLPADYVPVGVGPGADFRPRATTAAVRTGRPVDGVRCSAGPGPRYGAHLEIFVDDRVVAIPAGIGIEPPLRRDFAEERVLAGRCYYPAVTTDPTGTVELARGAPRTLGQLFAIWGQRLTRRRLGSFAITARAPLVAYVGDQTVGVARWPGNPAAIPLRRHTRIVLELRSRIPPHRTYAFPPGL